MSNFSHLWHLQIAHYKKKIDNVLKKIPLLKGMANRHAVKIKFLKNTNQKSISCGDAQLLYV